MSKDRDACVHCGGPTVAVSQRDSQYDSVGYHIRHCPCCDRPPAEVFRDLERGYYRGPRMIL